MEKWLLKGGIIGLAVATAAVVFVPDEGEAAGAITLGKTVSVTKQSSAPATEGGAGNAFILWWNGSTNISVNVQMSGTATNGVDYQFIPSVLQLGPGANTVMVNAIDDAAVELSETATLRVLPGTGYKVGSPSQRTITVVSNE